MHKYVYMYMRNIDGMKINLNNNDTIKKLQKYWEILNIGGGFTSVVYGAQFKPPFAYPNLNPSQQ